MALLKNPSSSLLGLVRKLAQTAKTSKFLFKHAAALFVRPTAPLCITTNTHGHEALGYDVPACHAEMNCLSSLRVVPPWCEIRPCFL